MKFGKGTKVNRSGFKGTVIGTRGKTQRYVRLNSGEVVVGVEDLKYWRKK